MLVLTVKTDETVLIGEDIWIRVLAKPDNNTLRLGIQAPRSIEIVREKLLEDQPTKVRRVVINDPPPRRYARGNG